MVKQKAEQFMNKLKEDNPNANWKNLITGIVLLLIVAVFSIWYFSDAPSVQDTNSDFIMEAEEDVIGANTDAQGEGNGEDRETTEVIAGEGLWHVARRVCGDGEKYVSIAEANGLKTNSELEKGQVLVVDCGSN